MGNRKWEMANGKLEMGDENCEKEMGHGKWEMAEVKLTVDKNPRKLKKKI